MRVMLATVGTGARVYDAISKSIDEADPDRLYLFGSEASGKTIVEVRKRLAEEEIIEEENIHFVAIADPNEHVLVFEAAAEVIEREKTNRLRDRNFVVDYTSGTKAMSVGLALAAVAYIPAASYRYVGSRIRDAQYGRVLSGEEDIKVRKSPMYYLAIEEQRLVMGLCSAGRYGRAEELLRDILDRNPSTRVRPRLEALLLLCRALKRWDAFDYAGALVALQECSSESLAPFGITADDVDARCRFLSALCEQSAVQLTDDDNEAAAQPKQGSNDPLPSMELCVDMLGNMRRREMEGRFADAMLRGRRVAEMAVQYLLFVRHGINTNAFALDSLTAAARDSLEQKKELLYITGEGMARVGFEGALRLLEALGDNHLAERFRGETFTKSLDTVKLSYLCYGFRVVEDAAPVAALREAVVEALKTVNERVTSSLSLDEALATATFPELK